jgi:hypothetical protein
MKSCYNTISESIIYRLNNQAVWRFVKEEAKEAEKERKRRFDGMA